MVSLANCQFMKLGASCSKQQALPDLVYKKVKLWSCVTMQKIVNPSVWFLLCRTGLVISVYHTKAETYVWYSIKCPHFFETGLKLTWHSI